MTPQEKSEGYTFGKMKKLNIEKLICCQKHGPNEPAAEMCDSSPSDPSSTAVEHYERVVRKIFNSTESDENPVH